MNDQRKFVLTLCACVSVLLIGLAWTELSNGLIVRNLPGSGDVLAADSGGSFFRTNVAGGTNYFAEGIIIQGADDQWYIETPGNDTLSFSNSARGVYLELIQDSTIKIFKPVNAATLNVSGTGSFGSVVVTNGVTSLGPGSGTLTLSSSNTVGGMVFQPAHNLPVVITNVFNFTNAAPGQVLTVLSSNNNAVTWGLGNNTSSAVSGAGNGNTNYLIALVPGNVNYFYLGSSNVHLYAIGGTVAGTPIFWSAVVTNLSASTWGINFSQGTNRIVFQGDNGTNAPSVLTNDTRLFLSGVSDGTNTMIGYTYFKPGQ